MPADLAFAIVLIVKMAITAGFVLAATVTAERAGPLVGGLVATLPIGAGPVYVFLAFDHDAHFIAQSAVASLAINAANVIFALVYALLAQKRSLIVSLGRVHRVAGARACGSFDGVELCRRRRGQRRGHQPIDMAGAAAAPRPHAGVPSALERPGDARLAGGTAGRRRCHLQLSTRAQAAAACSRCFRSC